MQTVEDARTTRSPVAAPCVDTEPWLVVVGIGDDGWVGLGPEARAAVERADVLVGGERHLALVPSEGKACESWPRDMRPFIDTLVQRQGARICVLASGDPLLFGAGTLFARRLGASDLRIIPHVSTFAVVCARMLWPQAETALLSVCGRPVEVLHQELFDGARLVIFSADCQSPHKVAQLLRDRGFDASRITVLEHLGGSDERLRSFQADALPADTVFADLNALAVQCVAGSEARILSKSPGLPDDAFLHDGQITKREVRSSSLALLSPRPGELLWDVGAGSGSVGIEWMRAAAHAEAIAIEARADRAARIVENAGRLGVPRLRVVEARAPEALEGLTTPDAVFVGGGLTEPGLLEACWTALKPWGRLVANAVTLESEAVLLQAHAEQGGDLVRLAVARAEPVGGFTGWRPAMPVTQWSIVKPGPGAGHTP